MKRARQDRKRLSHVDRMWLRMDDPTNLMMITGVTFFSGRLVRDDLRQLLEERLLPIPRFSERVVKNPEGRGHRWESALPLDFDWHLPEVELAPPGDDEALRALISEWMSTPLDAGRPLWQVHLVQGTVTAHASIRTPCEPLLQ